jgi:hypothetical protein
MGQEVVMRMEAKVYMSHTDLARIQAAAKTHGMTVSGYMRYCALAGADAVNIPQFRSMLEGQAYLFGDESKGSAELVKVGGE